MASNDVYQCLISYGSSFCTKTGISTNCTTPLWETSFEIPLIQKVPLTSLFLTVQEYKLCDGLATYIDVGRVMIPITPKEEEISGWYDLKDERGTMLVGEIQISVHVHGYITVDVDSLNSIPVHISPRKQQIRTRRRTPKSDSNREKSKEQRYWKELNGMIEKLDDKDTEHIAMHYLKYDY